MNNTKQNVELKIGNDVIEFGARVLLKGQEIIPALMPKSVFHYFMRERFGNKIVNVSSLRHIYEASLGRVYAAKYETK